jgi:RimJ/RimL family protein N-acetyltransferase
MPVLCETNRLTLRRMDASDANWACELDSDPEVMRYITNCVPTEPHVFAETIFPRMLASWDAGPQFGFYAASLRETGEPAGWFHLRPERDEPFEMELGYRLRRDLWGTGLATEGAQEILRMAFDQWGVPAVVGLTLAQNGSSRRVMAKCGMALNGAFIAPESWRPGWSEEERRVVRYRRQSPLSVNS